MHARMAVSLLILILWFSSKNRDVGQSIRGIEVEIGIIKMMLEL